MDRAVLAFSAAILIGGPSLASAQALTKCIAGQEVTDGEGRTGIIVADDDKLCQVRYPDGQVYGWIFWDLRPATATERPAPAVLNGAPTGQPNLPLSVNNSTRATVTVLRPSPNRTLVYRADRLGHVALTAVVNGAPIRFLVDTGASLVTLTPEDARAAGIAPSELIFSQRSLTANGWAREAPVTLREVRIEQLAIPDVPAEVSENLHVSLLGMSFLKRLKRFEMRENALTINW
jgi:clan AA aspartic protease (TIGR02281 family)